MEGRAVSEEGWFNGGDVRPLVVAVVVLPIMVYGLISVARDAWRGEVVKGSSPPGWRAFVLGFSVGCIVLGLSGWLVWSGLTEPMKTTEGLFAGGGHSWSFGVLGVVGVLVGAVFVVIPLAGHVGHKRAALHKARRQKHRTPARGRPVTETESGGPRE